MRKETAVAAALILVSTVPVLAGSKKKGEQERAMIEKMEAVPCGAKQHGVSGFGTIWASVGVTKVTSDEKLCPQYLLRTDEMDYAVRPTNKKDPVVLPVGKEAEIKLKHNQIDLRVEDGGDGKMHTYQIVAMNPVNADSDKSASSVPVDDTDDKK